MRYQRSRVGGSNPRIKPVMRYLARVLQRTFSDGLSVPTFRMDGRVRCGGWPLTGDRCQSLSAQAQQEVPTVEQRRLQRTPGRGPIRAAGGTCECSVAERGGWELLRRPAPTLVSSVSYRACSWMRLPLASKALMAVGSGTGGALSSGSSSTPGRMISPTK